MDFRSLTTHPPPQQHYQQCGCTPTQFQVNAQSNTSNQNCYSDNIPPTWARDIMCKIDEVNKRLGKMDELEMSIKSMSLQLNSVTTDVKEIRGRVSELEKSQQYISDSFEEVKQGSDKAIEISTYFDQGLRDLSEKISAENEKLREEILDLQARSMRDNLLFFNIEESELEDCKKVILEICEKDLEIPSAMTDIVIERAHRIGPRKVNKNRPIVAKFNRYEQRETVRKNSYKLSKNNPRVSIGEQFPKEIQERRKSLIPKMKEARSQGNRTKLVKDKLYINGNLYREVHTTGPTTRLKSQQQGGTRRGAQGTWKPHQEEMEHTGNT